MKEYTTETANELTYLFRAFTKGLIYDSFFYNKVGSILEFDSFKDSFMEFHSRRIISNLPPTKETLDLIDAMQVYVKMFKYKVEESYYDNRDVNIYEFDNDIYEILTPKKIYNKVEILLIEWMLKYEPEYDKLLQQNKMQPQPEEIHIKPIPKERRKGKPIKSFSDCFYCETEEKENLLKRLHSILKGQKGKNVALAVLVCVENGKMQKPTFTAINNEFEDIGNESGFNKYYSGRPFTDEEKEGMKKALFTK